MLARGGGRAGNADRVVWSDGRWELVKSTTKIHAMFSKEGDISLGRTCKMVPKWERGSRDPEKRERINKALCGGAVRYEQEGPLAATNAV